MNETLPWDIQPIQSEHRRESFNSGNQTLDDWLKRYATQFQRRNLARTFVAVAPPDTSVVGYYAISGHAVRYDALPADLAKGLPRIDVPVVLLARLAVSKNEQGKGLGAFLLVDALQRSQSLSDQIGIRAVEVDAIDATARRFYLHFGFVALQDDPNHLILPINMIRGFRP